MVNNSHFIDHYGKIVESLFISCKAVPCQILSHFFHHALSFCYISSSPQNKAHSSRKFIRTIIYCILLPPLGRIDFMLLPYPYEAVTDSARLAGWGGWRQYVEWTQPPATRALAFRIPQFLKSVVWREQLRTRAHSQPSSAPRLVKYNILSTYSLTFHRKYMRIINNWFVLYSVGPPHRIPFGEWVSSVAPHILLISHPISAAHNSQQDVRDGRPCVSPFRD